MLCHTRIHINLVRKTDVCQWENCSMGFCRSGCRCAAAQRAFCRHQAKLLVQPLSLVAFVLEQL